MDIRTICILAIGQLLLDATVTASGPGRINAASHGLLLEELGPSYSEAGSYVIPLRIVLWPYGDDFHVTQQKCKKMHHVIESVLGVWQGEMMSFHSTQAAENHIREKRQLDIYAGALATYNFVALHSLSSEVSSIRKSVDIEHNTTLSLINGQEFLLKSWFKDHDFLRTLEHHVENITQCINRIINDIRCEDGTITLFAQLYNSELSYIVQHYADIWRSVEAGKLPYIPRLHEFIRQHVSSTGGHWDLESAVFHVTEASYDVIEGIMIAKRVVYTGDRLWTIANVGIIRKSLRVKLDVPTHISFKGGKNATSVTDCKHAPESTTEPFSEGVVCLCGILTGLIAKCQYNTASWSGNVSTHYTRSGVLIATRGIDSVVTNRGDPASIRPTVDAEGDGQFLFFPFDNFSTIRAGVVHISTVPIWKFTADEVDLNVSLTDMLTVPLEDLPLLNLGQYNRTAAWTHVNHQLARLNEMRKIVESDNHGSHIRFSGTMLAILVLASILCLVYILVIRKYRERKIESKAIKAFMVSGFYKNEKEMDELRDSNRK